MSSQTIEFEQLPGDEKPDQVFNPWLAKLFTTISTLPSDDELGMLGHFISQEKYKEYVGNADAVFVPKQHPGQAPAVQAIVGTWANYTAKLNAYLDEKNTMKQIKAALLKAIDKTSFNIVKDDDSAGCLKKMRS